MITEPFSVQLNVVVVPLVISVWYLSGGQHGSETQLHVQCPETGPGAGHQGEGRSQGRSGQLQGTEHGSHLYMVAKMYIHSQKVVSISNTLPVVLQHEA